MSNATTRKYIKTKFEGVFYRMSAKRDPRTGELDRVYAFWYSDNEGKGHWKTVGRHSQGIRPQTARLARTKFLAEFSDTGENPEERRKMTVGKAIEAYVAWAEATNRSVFSNISQYNMHMKPRLHNVPIGDVTPAMLTNIMREMLKTPLGTARKEKAKVKFLSPESINHAFAFIRAAVNRAVASGLWRGGNPFATKRGGPWEALKVNNKRLRFFTPDEARALLAELKVRVPQLHDMALLSLRTGLRATEIFRLKGQDLDVHSGVLHIIAKGGMREAVRIPEDMIAMLAGYNRAPGEPIFKTPESGKAYGRIPPSFKLAVAKLKLASEDGDTLYAVTFHTFRHTFASWLAQSSQVSLLELQKLMRHKHISMTLRYAHLIPGQEVGKLAIIDAMLTQPAE